ncbi:sorbitol dehydrogenase [Paracoccus gahaiensis]|uniref:Sorbitol dehydrogenase n=2 Tax=Paracoccus gahaiensis TaxID=1706839 RepID=A0A4U0R630_9RHOB|nr:sorbitol dehydrogenase [Paracoccus gahaiensis]
MLALRKITPAAGIDLTDQPAPAMPQPGWIVVTVHAAGICGSDLHADAWDASYNFMASSLPLTLGHEFAGIVDSVGADVTDLAPGDPVVCKPTITCGACPACRADDPQGCTARRIIGLHLDGGFAPLVAIPADNARALPRDLPLDVAALAEPLAVSVTAVDVAVVQPGHRVAVLGPGPIGLGIALVAQARGAHVLLVGLNDTLRLDRARAMGVDACADLRDSALPQAIARHLGAAPDIVIEATGHPSSVIEALQAVRSGGVVTVAGIHGAALSLDLNLLVRGKKQLRGTHDSTRQAFAEAIARLAADPGRYAGMISHRLPLSQARQGFDLARSRAAQKVMLFPQETPE